MRERKTLTRRQFIERAGVAVAAPYVVSSSALARPQAGERITMGVIGCGGMGRGDMRQFLGMPDVQVVAVADPDLVQRNAAQKEVEAKYAAESASGTFRGCASFGDYRELLARDDIDAVIQATPDHWHALVVVDAARAGKDIYGEKPLSLTIHQGRVMSDTVARYGRVFQTGSQQRSDARFRKACELVRGGRIGMVRRVTCGLSTGSRTGNQPAIPVPDGFDYDLWLGPAPEAPYCEQRTHWNFRWILDYSGGQVTDWGAHHIDIAHWGLGLGMTGPVEVEGEGEFPTDGLWNAAVNYRFVARYAKGVEIVVTNDFENGVKFEGEDGWIFVSRSRIEAHPMSLLMEAPPDSSGGMGMGMSSVGGDPGAGDMLYPTATGHHRNFIDCVRTRMEPIAPIEQAHRTITVAHLGNIAMQLGRKVRWNPDTERFVDDPKAERMRDRAMRAPWRL